MAAFYLIVLKEFLNFHYFASLTAKTSSIFLVNYLLILAHRLAFSLNLLRQSIKTPNFFIGPLPCISNSDFSVFTSPLAVSLKSFLRSSVNGGTLIMIKSPLVHGLKPRLLVWMAFQFLEASFFPRLHVKVLASGVATLGYFGLKGVCET